MTIGVDVFEPEKLYSLIEQSVPITVGAYNDQGFADYIFAEFDGSVHQIERKQLGEILGGADSMVYVEEQLQREIPQANTTDLLIENVAVPHPNGTLEYVLDAGSKGKDYLRLKRLHKERYSKLIAWVYSLQRVGINVIWTSNVLTSAAAIVSVHNNCQKEEHTTMQRHVKPRVIWHPNPHIVALLGLSAAYSLNIGEGKASRIVDRFHDLWGFLEAKPEQIAELEGFSKASSEKILKSIGRNT